MKDTTNEYRILGYCLLFLYLGAVLSQASTLYQIGTPNWGITGWFVIVLVIVLSPGLPGLLLIAPARFLNSKIATGCQSIGIFGIVLSIGWGFVFTPKWWIIALLAIGLNWASRKVYAQNRRIV
jgi:hypothetical protein